MSDDRFKAWLTFWQFVLGTVVLGAFSTIISNQIQTREVEIKEQEANAKFLEQALQEDVGVRRRLAQYFAHVTRSEDLRARWADYAKLVETEYQDTLSEKQSLQKEIEQKNLDATARDMLQQRIAELEQQLSPKPVAAAVVQSRVYIHIASAAQRPAAEKTAELLRANGISVPRIIEVRTDGPDRTELRYFRTSEQAEAEGIAASARELWPDIKVKYIGGYEASTAIRARHYELWVSAAATARRTQ